MGQEFIIKSQGLEDKINQLLPSQGGFQAGVDLSASTTVIPIVDLTETAEGSSLRQDLQTAFSLTAVTFHEINNTSSTVVNTTGYYRVFGFVNYSAAGTAKIEITDGTTTKDVMKTGLSSSAILNESFDFNVFLPAGDSLVATSTANNVRMRFTTRQIADINGNLVNP